MSDKPNKVTSIGLRIVLIASLMLLLLATATETSRLPQTENLIPPPTQSVARDTLIVPGARIGPVTLGLPTAKMREVLGPGQLRPEGDGTVCLYPEIGLAIYSQNDRVVSVTVRSPIFATRRGVQVGSDVSQAIELLPGSYEKEGSGKRYKLHSWSEGWHLEIVDDKVSYIQITVKLTTPSNS